VEVGRVINSLRKKKKKVKRKRKNYDKRTNLNAITFFFFKKKRKRKRERNATPTPSFILPNAYSLTLELQKERGRRVRRWDLKCHSKKLA